MAKQKNAAAAPALPLETEAPKPGQTIRVGDQELDTATGTVTKAPPEPETTEPESPVTNGMSTNEKQDICRSAAEAALAEGIQEREALENWAERNKQLHPLPDGNLKRFWYVFYHMYKVRNGGKAPSKGQPPKDPDANPGPGDSGTVSVRKTRDQAPPPPPPPPPKPSAPTAIEILYVVHSLAGTENGLAKLIEAVETIKPFLATKEVGTFERLTSIIETISAINGLSKTK